MNASTALETKGPMTFVSLINVIALTMTLWSEARRVPYIVKSVLKEKIQRCRQVCTAKPVEGRG